MKTWFQRYFSILPATILLVGATCNPAAPAETLPWKVASSEGWSVTQAAVDPQPLGFPVPAKTLAQATAPNGKMLSIVNGDLTQEKVDAITNAAAASLQLGGGVAGAIKKADPSGTIQKACDDYLKAKGISSIPVGSAMHTVAGDLKQIKWVIHTVGPIPKKKGTSTSEEDLLLYSAVENALKEATSVGAQTVSIPAIATGIFGFPLQRGVRIIMDAAMNYIHDNPTSSIQEVRLINLDVDSGGKPQIQATAKQFVIEFKSRFK